VSRDRYWIAFVAAAITLGAIATIAHPLGEEWDPLLLSLQVATLAMVISLVAGTAFALLLDWKKLPARDLVGAIVMAPLVLPPTVLGYYVLVAIGRGSALGRAWHWLTGGELTFSFTGAVIAGAVGSLPLVIRSVRVGLDSVDPSLVAAARTLGARPRRVIFTIVLPLAAPGVIAGAMLGFARALGDYGITSMVAGARIDGFGIESTPTAPIYVVNEVIADREANAFRMAIVMTIVGIAIMFAANRLTRRLHHNRA
jgi:molybdate transport system permease protein